MLLPPGLHSPQAVLRQVTTNPCFAALFVLVTIVAPAEAFFNNDRWLLTATDDLVGPPGTAVTLTWGLAEDGTVVPNVLPGVNRNSNLIERLDGWFGAGDGGTDYTTRPWFGYLQSSFDRWGDTSGVTFVYEPNDDGATHGSSTGILGRRADIRLAGGRYDGTVGGNRGTLAFSIAPDNADIFLDTDDVSYYSNPAGNAFSLRHTLMHEIGHSLGLGHLTSNDTAILMEPFAQASFDGPQADDIRGVQFLYGDPFEAAGGNNSLATATYLGPLASGGLLSIGTASNAMAVGPTETDFVSINRSGDLDYYRFTLAEPAVLELMLSPAGPTYNERVEGAPVTARIDASAVGDLALELIGPGGSIDSVDASAAGQSESLQAIVLDSGDYTVRIAGQTNTTQLYHLQITAAALPLPGDYNADGRVDAADYTVWRDTLGSTDQLAADGDQSGEVDADDLSVWQQNYGRQSAPSVTAIPEPGGVTLLAGLLACRRGFRARNR